MKIIGVTGLPGSGKGFISEIASEKGAKIVSMGDIVREKAEERGESSNETATTLRQDYGKYIVAELTIEKIKKILEDGFDSTIIVDGIRSPCEVNLFKENFDEFIIVSVFANPDLRFERLKARKRADDSIHYDAFVERDQRELGFGLGEVISLSNKMIINESDSESFKKEINKFLEECDV